VKITYDTEADALYISLRPRAKPVVVRDVAKGVAVDVDAQGRAVGFEILWASEMMSNRELSNILYEELVSEKQKRLRLPQARQSPHRVGARS